MSALSGGRWLCGSAAELCKKLRQEQAQMRDEAEQLTSEIKSLEADVRYSPHCNMSYNTYIKTCNAPYVTRMLIVGMGMTRD